MPNKELSTDSKDEIQEEMEERIVQLNQIHKALSLQRHIGITDKEYMLMLSDYGILYKKKTRWESPCLWRMSSSILS